MRDLVIYGTSVSPFVHDVEAALKTQGETCAFEFIGIFDMAEESLEVSLTRRAAVLRDRRIGREGVVDNVTSCQNILGRQVLQRVDLS